MPKSKGNPFGCCLPKVGLLISTLYGKLEKARRKSFRFLLVLLLVACRRAAKRCLLLLRVQEGTLKYTFLETSVWGVIPEQGVMLTARDFKCVFNLKAMFVRVFTSSLVFDANFVWGLLIVGMACNVLCPMDCYLSSRSKCCPSALNAWRLLYVLYWITYSVL